MFNSLRIQNFKSWQDTGTIQFGAITGFFGTNSSGKTSILQFLLMLKQTVESSDRAQVLNLGDERSYVELGTIYDIIHKHKNPSEIKFTLNWKANKLYLANTLPIEFNPFDYNDINFSAVIYNINNDIILKNIQYTIDKYKMELTYEPHFGNGENYQYSFKTKGLNIERTNRQDSIIIEPLRFYGFPNIINTLYHTDNIQLDLEHDLELMHENMYYLGPLREYPSRLYTWGGERPTGVGTRGEKSVAAILASKNPRNNSRFIEPEFNIEEKIAFWLKELGLLASFTLRPIAPNRKEYEVRVRKTLDSPEVFLTDVGFGVSQLLPVLVLLFYVPEGSTIILEQPEIHLHPAVQAGLADVFIDAIKRRNVQIILESHSEHLLQRLQLRMAEKGLNPDKEFDAERAKLYFTSIEEGRSVLTPLQLDEYGNINNWPEGFFGDTLGDAAAMMKAEMKRKMQQP